MYFLVGQIMFEFDINVVVPEFPTSGSGLNAAQQTSIWTPKDISTEFCAFQVVVVAKFKWPTLRIHQKLFWEKGFGDAHDAAY